MALLRRLNNKGQLLIELLVAVGLSAILIPAVTAGFIASRQGQAQQRQRLEATTLAREAGDAIRVVRESGWANVSVNGTYHPEISGSSWVLVSGAQSINDFTRSIEITDVFRDTGGAIVESGGLLDPSTKHIEVTVSWGTPVPSSVTNAYYLTRLDNNAWVQTTQDDFDAGTLK